MGKDLKRNIEKSLKFGKSIEKFINMEKILEETRDNLVSSYAAESVLEAQQAGSGKALPAETAPTSDVTVSVALPSGKILYSTDSDLKHDHLPRKARRDYGKSGQKQEALQQDFGKYGQRYYLITLPIYAGFKKSWAGTVVISFHEKQVKALLDKVSRRNLITISIILGGGLS